MAAKAALVLLLSSAAAYRSSQRVVPRHSSEARSSAAVIAAERRRRFGAVAALSGMAAAPSTARAITWKVRDRRPCIRRVAAMAWRFLIRNGAFLTISMCRRRDGVTPTQDDREDVNAVFMDKYPKAILIESGIALVILALSKAGVGPLAEKFREGE